MRIKASAIKPACAINVQLKVVSFAVLTPWQCRVATNEDVEMPAKVIVFSQWRRMLDLIQSALQARHIRFSRLDGTMGVSARAHAIAQFTVRLYHTAPRK